MNLKQIRKEKGLSAAKLSELSGVPLRTLEDIERRGDCLVSNALKLADALGVSLDTLCRSVEGTEA
jgi:transcriptional regulator with XRE-family HTH domain